VVDAVPASTRHRPRPAERQPKPPWQRVDAAVRGWTGRGRPARAVPTSSRRPSARSRPPEVEILSRRRRAVRSGTCTGCRPLRVPSRPIRRRRCLYIQRSPNYYQWCRQDQIIKTKTKITRPRPRPPEVNKGTWRI